jgi:hypothetical protein
MDKRELLHSLREHNVQLNKAAEALFEDRRFSPLAESKVIEIAFVSVADLGFTEGATYDQLTARARESGLVCGCSFWISPRDLPGFLQRNIGRLPAPSLSRRPRLMKAMRRQRVSTCGVSMVCCG